ncbi:MAG: energy-coupling factor ABC transporter permease [Halieaceae bacterium]|jgi:uncharacterized membrane protein|nr:energy-coupling factor ABC transporter permease [Halieaceae bacterium]
MFIASDLIPAWLSLACAVALLSGCSLSAWYAPWRSVLRVSARQHLLLGGVCACVVLWLMSVHIVDNLWLHFLGITALVTLVGLRFALLVGAVATLLFALLIRQPLAGVPLAWLTTVAAPALVSRLVVYRVRGLRSNNLFLYLLGVGFAGGILAMLAAVGTGLALLWLCGQQPWVIEAVRNWPLLMLILFPEGFINGMMVTTLTVFYPQLVKTFDETHYLGD